MPPYQKYGSVRKHNISLKNIKYTSYHGLHCQRKTIFMNWKSKRNMTVQQYPA